MAKEKNSGMNDSLWATQETRLSSRHVIPGRLISGWKLWGLRAGSGWFPSPLARPSSPHYPLPLPCKRLCLLHSSGSTWPHPWPYNTSTFQSADTPIGALKIWWGNCVETYKLRKWKHNASTKHARKASGNGFSNTTVRCSSGCKWTFMDLFSGQFLCHFVVTSNTE